MKILVVSDVFYNGGLEKQIISHYETLNRKVEYVYTFTKYNENKFLSDKKIYKLKDDNSILSLVENTLALKKIINEEKIDVIHVHPFFLLYPAMFASQLTNTKIVYTIHGIISINYPIDTNIKILYKLFFSELEPTIFSVTKKFDSILKNNYYIKNLNYLPNTVSYSDKPLINYKANNTWCMISRFDKDKIDDVFVILENMEYLGIKKLDIYGTGSEEEQIKEKISELNLDKKVTLKGYINGGLHAVDKEYNGVIGLGQVALEALSANMPVLLTGYGMITGLIDKNLYLEVKDYNFVNKFSEEQEKNKIKEDIKNIDKNIKKYQLSNEVKKEFSNEILFSEYLEKLDKTKFVKSRELLNVFDELMSLYKEGKIKLTENIYNSRLLFDILKNNFRGKTIIPEIIDYFDYRSEENFDFRVSNIESRINELDSIENKIGLTTTLRNTKNTVTNKLKNKKKTVAAIMCIKNEEKYLQGFLDHIRNYVDYVIALDDGSTDNTINILENDSLVKKIIKKEYHESEDWNELANRIEILTEAKNMKADFVLCCDPDERFEENFLKQIKVLVKNNNLYGVYFRELWDSNMQYRIDGIWGQKAKYILFPLSEQMDFSYDRNHHIPWHYKEIENKKILLDYNLYHFKMVDKKEREKRKNLYNKIDPNKEMQAIGYDYLTDEENINLVKIPTEKMYDKTTIK